MLNIVNNHTKIAENVVILHHIRSKCVLTQEPHNLNGTNLLSYRLHSLHTDMTANHINNCPICNGNHLIHKLSYTDNISNQTFDILQCSDCGMLITQHAPRLSDLSQYHPDKEAACYKQPQDKVGKWLLRLNNRWNKEQIRIVCEEADRQSGVLLEMGCKQGRFAGTIRNSGWIAHAVEQDNTAREYANEHFQLQAESGEVLFNIKPRSYNVVVAWDTLGECIDLHRTIEQLSQLIVSDGTLIIAFHDASCNEAQSLGNNWQGWDAPRKRWHLTPDAFERLAEQHNLTIVNRRNSRLRSFITTLTTLMAINPNKNFFATLCDSFSRSMKYNNTYYIYTIKRQ